MTKNNLITAGGQAVIEGVMMRSTDKVAVAVRTPNKKIVMKQENIQPLGKKYKILSWPLIRGVIGMAEMMVVGIKALNWSANQSLGEEEELTWWQLACTMLLSFGFAILIFKFVPLLIAEFANRSSALVQQYYLLFNLIDGLSRIALFLLYIYIISFMEDIKRLFMYHGAEHKAVHCYEQYNGDKKKLTVKNVQKFTTLHPRCGTSFILIVLILSVMVYSFIPKDYGFWAKLGLRLLLLPLLAGISYEILRFSAKYRENWLMKIIIWPGLMTQKLTTKEPKDDMVVVAITALKAVI
jgi:uncharacterized protein YqhQ